MTEEYKLGRDLEELTQILHERKKSGVVEFLSRKLKALKASYETHKQAYQKMASYDSVSGNENKEDANGIPRLPTQSAYFERHKGLHEVEEKKRRQKMREDLRQFRQDIKNTRMLRVCMNFDLGTILCTL